MKKKKPYNYKKLIFKSNGLKGSFEKAILKPSIYFKNLI